MVHLEAYDRRQAAMRVKNMQTGLTKISSATGNCHGFIEEN